MKKGLFRQAFRMGWDEKMVLRRFYEVRLRGSSLSASLLGTIDLLEGSKEILWGGNDGVDDG